MSTYGYTPDDMTSIGNQLITIQQEIQDKITTAQSSVSGLIGSGFSTAVASGAYSQQFTDLATGLAQVNQNMGPLGTFLVQYAQSVVDMDTQMGQSLGG